MKICIWTGPSYEPWGPPSLDKGGIGGSETACIHMADLFARLGHDVVVFGDHNGFEGCYAGSNLLARPTHGPFYHHYKEALENRSLLECDVFISSRDKAALRLEPKARHKVLWVHDIHVGDDWLRELLKYDQIFCLSKFARDFFLSYYPQHGEALKSRLVLTRNGIDTSRYQLRDGASFDFSKEGEAKFFYSSSPDRGLDLLLNMWPEIRAIREDAELHVYYGFETWQAMAKFHKSQNDSLRIAWFLDKMKALAPQGVIYHGRVGQAELAKAQLQSLLWLYPTSFKRTSCITAIEAQAAGAVPVTTRLGALAETVKCGILLEPPALSEAYRTSFLGMVKGLLGESAEMRCELAATGRAWALENCGWDKVAVEWLTMFEAALTEKET